MRFGIIAAGQGSRLEQEGCQCPKPLVRLAGVPLLQRLIEQFLQCDAERIAVIINTHQPQTERLLDSLARVYPIDVVMKDTPSSMHSFHALSPYLVSGEPNAGANDRFCVTTVDTVFNPVAFAGYVEAFRRSRSDGMMGVTTYVDDEKPLYVSVDDAMRITGFHDVQGTAGSGSGQAFRHVSAGIYGLTGRALQTLERCIGSGQSRMRAFQRQLVADGLCLQAYDMGKVIDIDHVNDIAKAESLLQITNE